MRLMQGDVIGVRYKGRLAFHHPKVPMFLAFRFSAFSVAFLLDLRLAGFCVDLES